MKNLWKKVNRWLPGAVISLVLLGILLHYIDFSAVWTAFRKANIFLLCMSFAGSVIWFFTRAVMWRTLLQNKPSYKVTFFSLSEGYLMNNFLPFKLGEVGRAFLLSRKTGMSFMEVIPTIVIERAMDLLFSAGILIFSIPFVLGVSGAGNIAYIIGGVMLVGLISLFILVQKRELAFTTFQRISLKWPRLQDVGGRLLNSFFEGLAVLADLRLFVSFLFLITLTWVIAVVQFYLLMRAFFPQADMTWALFALGAAAFGGAIPSLPGSIGTLDAAVGAAIAFLTKDIDTAAAFIVVMRLFNYLVTGIPALIGLSNEGTTLAGLYRDVIGFRVRSNKDQKME